MSRWGLQISGSVFPQLNLYLRSTDPEVVGIRSKSPSNVFFSCETVAALTEFATAVSTTRPVSSASREITQNLLAPGQ
jgi:hypothetical protein